MRTILIDALKAHYKGIIKTSQANVEIYLQNSVGVGEHPNVIETIDLEIAKIAEAEDKLHTLESYFVSKELRI